MRVSVKKLVGYLNEFGMDVTESVQRDRCEAYGRDVRAYIDCSSVEQRHKVERFLRSKGCDVSRNYARAVGNMPEAPIAEVKVTYFKAWHWEE